jgi:2-oxoglutarate ferredoxin oxidoreductase subunit gamma
VVQTQSYGIQARGGASQSTVIISDGPINFPEVLTPDILLCLSQEAYKRYGPRLREEGLLIIDADLVDAQPEMQVRAFPFTAEAEKMGRRIAANVIALGTLAVMTGAVEPASLAQAIPSRLPERNVATALEALDVGVKLAATPEASVP